MSCYTHPTNPGDIEQQSFSIITQLLGDRQLDPEQAPIIKRCIHTSADFDYADTLYFSPGAVPAIGKALTGGACLVTDTMMARSGVNKRAAARLGVDVFCFMADEDVAAQAAERGVTRAIIAVEKALKLDRPMVFAVGNAPTALIRLHQAMREGYSPEGIIAAPVGFVNVVESKEQIIQDPVPCIVARGRKGGSAIAAAICNAILYNLAGEINI
jgi:precorrin-8X/cobalt-precorrin-8 methylmutase